jgi:tRNA G18 (ribose-2'-O)-methylase SpoU
MNSKHLDQRSDDAKRKIDGSAFNSPKKLKWSLKQERKLQLDAEEAARDAWILANKDICQRLTLSDVAKIKAKIAANVIPDDISPYVNLKVNSDSSFLRRNRFIAEGSETVRVLLQQVGNQQDSSYSSHVIILSIMVKPSAFFGNPVHLQKTYESSHKRFRPKVFIADEKVFSEIAGFPVARGAMACGLPVFMEETIFLEMAMQYKENVRILVLDGITNPTDMGSIIRCAAAFGIKAVVLSKDCCDPWCRQAVRVSMGYISLVSLVRLEKWSMQATILRLGEYGILSYAAVFDSEIQLEQMSKGDVSNSWCLVLGQDKNGNSREIADVCSFRLGLSTANTKDILSVSINAGIFLHGLAEKSALFK